MFGVYTLQMPAAIQTRLSDSSNKQRAGTFGGVAVMGALSALIVTACVAPALVGALLVISQGGDIIRGALALFAMSLGMGTPLLVIGTSAGRLLPKAGAWMDTVKQLFGALMLGVAAWMLARLMSDRWALLLYCVPFIAAFLVLWRLQNRGPARAPRPHGRTRRRPLRDPPGPRCRARRHRSPAPAAPGLNFRPARN